MEYIEVRFTCIPNNEIITSVLTSYIADLGFDSFMDSNEGLIAFITKNAFDDKELKQTLKNFPLDCDISYTRSEIADQNWNEEWEKNHFEPLIIDNKCAILSTEHQLEKKYPYTIFINPKMAFGTGHHQTTSLIIKELLEVDIANKQVLDMGCGTAILAILAAMRNADPITAIDIDEWAYNNSIENIKLNNISNIDVKLGGAEQLGKESFDVVIANINRNILLNDIKKYANVMNDKATILMSGFYTEDIAIIEKECNKYNLHLKKHTERENWAMVVFQKG